MNAPIIVNINRKMNFIKRKFSMNQDPDKDEDQDRDSTNGSTGGLLDNINSKRASLWTGFKSKIKSDRTSPSEEDIPVSNNDKPHHANSGQSFFESVKMKLSQVRLYENGDTDSDEENDKKRTGMKGETCEVAPLIDTADNSESGAEDGAELDGESTVAIPDDEQTAADDDTTNNNTTASRRKRLKRRQDSMTGKDIYLNTVSSKLQAGTIDADVTTVLISPDKAVNEFKFKDDSVKSTKNTLSAPSNLINFDSVQNLADAAREMVDPIVHREEDYEYEYESSGDDSSEPVYSEDALNRSDSLQSLNSNQYIDSEDEEMAKFAGKFVDNIFSSTSSNSNEDKALFGKYVRDGNFRLQFARCISDKRITDKEVTEQTFYQLVQYFAVVLFECDEADDFSPVLILMNMCFTFYYLSSRGGKVEHNYLSSYLKNQPIWQSLRYWNASFYESVQDERKQKPLPTNKDSSDDERQDRQFQENIIFAKLGAFLYKMGEFGLKDEWCFEFLRKQSTIGNLSEEQIAVLRENIGKMNDNKIITNRRQSTVTP